MSDEAPREDNGTGLPASFELVWGVRERPARGPKRGLSLDQIVGAAVQLAETEGLAAVSMSRVAAALGTGAMTLYRYVAAKDELLALMVDEAGGRPPPPTNPDEGWREGLSRWAWAYRDVLHRHRWIVRVPISGPPITPNQIAWLEDGLHSLRATNMTEAEKLRVILLLSGYVRNDATLVTDLLAAVEVSGQPANEIMPSYSRLLLHLTGEADFPAIHRAIAGGAFDDDADATGADMTPEFVFGLERILDGIEALVRQRA